MRFRASRRSSFSERQRKSARAIFRRAVESLVGRVGLRVHRQEAVALAEQIDDLRRHHAVAVVGDDHRIVVRQERLEPGIEGRADRLRHLLVHEIDLEQLLEGIDLDQPPLEDRAGPGHVQEGSLDLGIELLADELLVRILGAQQREHADAIAESGRLVGRGQHSAGEPLFRDVAHRQHGLLARLADRFAVLVFVDDRLAHEQHRRGPRLYRARRQCRRGNNACGRHRGTRWRPAPGPVNRGDSAERSSRPWRSKRQIALPRRGRWPPPSRGSCDSRRCPDRSLPRARRCQGKSTGWRPGPGRSWPRPRNRRTTRRPRPLLANPD